jgi:NADH:ubiquinone oxidoreductase subunit 5 (subunit L)/multisubunit Na+/H+ antiporter MnhA subunit
MLALEINNTFGNNIDNHDFLGILPELYLLGVIINSLIISIKALGSNNNKIVHKKTHVISGVINKILENLNVLLFVWPFLYIDLHFGELIGTICNLINNPAIVEVEELSFERSFSGLSYFALNNAVAVSAYILFFKILVILTTSIILRSSVRYLRHHNKQLTEFITIILLVMFFLIVLISAQDLLVAFVSIIGFSLNIYVLILSDSENQMAREAAIKYYYLSVFSSGLLAFGS